MSEDERVGLWLNVERQRQRQVSVVREAVEAATDNTDPPDAYFDAISDVPEEAEAKRYWDLNHRSDRRLRRGQN